MSISLVGYMVETLLELSEPQIRLAILGGAMVFFPVIAVPEGWDSTWVLHVNGNVIFASYTPRSEQPLMFYQEAGRLRRKAAATLFSKVFDLGGYTATSAAVLPTASFCRALRPGLAI